MEGLCELESVRPNSDDKTSSNVVELGDRSGIMNEYGRFVGDCCGSAIKVSCFGFFVFLIFLVKFNYDLCKHK